MSAPFQPVAVHAEEVPPRRSRLLLAAVAVGTLGVVAAVPFIALRLTTNGDITSVDGAAKQSNPRRDVALVLGAGLRPDGSPSFVLRARVETAAALYKRGLIRKLVMSGDNSLASYDEVSAMKDYAESIGVVRADVILDYAGFRTLDSCVRIRKVFGQTRIFVVSQRFHLPRAVHLCRWAGVDTLGVIANDPRGQSSRLKSLVREVPASGIAWAEVHVFGRGPKYLGDPIDIDNPPAAALEQPGAG